jgi:hypothetical protein
MTLATLIAVVALLALAAVSLAIDVNAETVVTLSQLAGRLPRRRLGKPVHPSTVHRWRKPGLRGVQLECVRVGGIWCTSTEAFQRWIDRLTAAERQGQQEGGGRGLEAP